MLNEECSFVAHCSQKYAFAPQSGHQTCADGEVQKTQTAPFKKPDPNTRPVNTLLRTSAQASAALSFLCL